MPRNEKLIDTVLRVIEQRVDSADVQGTPEGMAEEIVEAILSENQIVPLTTKKKSRRVTILLFNRKGKGSHQEVITFTSFEALETRVNILLEQVPFYKVICELKPNWKATARDNRKFRAIEEGQDLTPA